MIRVEMIPKAKREARQKVAGRKSAERARKRENGLQRLELWAHADDAAQLRRLAADLTNARKEKSLALSKL